MNAKIVITLFGLGFALGWVSHSLYLPTDGEQPELSISMPASDGAYAPPAIDAAVPLQRVDVDAESTRPNAEILPSPQMPAGMFAGEEFSALLDGGRYDAAIEQLVGAYRNDSKRFLALKKILLSFLKQLLQSGHNGDFTELADQYLADFYEDIDVLLLLAEFNKNTGFYFEAVGVFHLADEYAHSIDAKAQVRKSYDRFIRDVDAHLAAQSDWYRLSQVYHQSEIIGLLSEAQRLRQAAVYIENGDLYLGRKILLDMRDGGQMSAPAQELLARLDSGDDEIKSRMREPEYASVIDLQMRGNHYLVDLSFANGASARFLIDTGASITTLSRSGFERIGYRADLSELGTRMFSTANGVVRGRVFRASQLHLGGFRLENIDIAVLDFEMSDGVEGLLGMNVMGKFKFQIDQENRKLLLSPR